MGIPKMADIYSLKLSLIEILLFYLAKVETIKGAGSRYK